MEFKKEIQLTFSNYNIFLNEQQCADFEQYYFLLKEWNNKFNLTTILEQSNVIIKHFLDSVLCHEEIKQQASVIDIGAGAGFPGIPLKIFRPDLTVTLIDGSHKRVEFMNEVINKLKLKNIVAIHERCEVLALKPEYREQFDVCVARAVAKLNTLNEYCIPFVKLYGKLIAYKAKDIETEIADAENVTQLLGARLEKTNSVQILETNSMRTFVIYKKANKTPIKFPRGGNKPKTNPL